MNKKVGIFITVRLESTRLPYKAIKEVNGKKMIEYLVERIKNLNPYEEIYICTTNSEEDYLLDNLSNSLNVNVFHGNKNNVLRRHLDCAKENDIDFIIGVDGDDIFCSPELIKQVISKNDSIYDIITTKNYPFGTNVMGYKTSILENILKQNNCKIIDTGWGELLNNPQYNILKLYASDDEKSDARLTLDYEEDFEFFKRLITDLNMHKSFISQKEIIDYIKCNAEIKKINMFLNEEYWNNFNNKKILKNLSQ